MPRKGITEEQVAAAMAALEAEGLIPSVRLVRERLGTGSHGTISPLMAAVRIKGKTTAPVTPAVPEELTAHLQTLLGSVWESSYKLASAENQVLRQTLHEQAYSVAQVHEDLCNAVREIEKRVLLLHEIGDNGPLSSGEPDTDTEAKSQ